MRKQIILLTSLMLIVLSVGFSYIVCADEEEPDFYNQSLKNAVGIQNKEKYDEIQNEIYEQALAVLEINQISANLKKEDIDLGKAVKAVFIVNRNNETETLKGEVDQLKDVQYVLIERLNNSSKDRDVLNSRFLDYFWKVPVIETDNAYLYATVIIYDWDNISISTTYVPDKKMSDVSYLFDRRLVKETLEKNNKNVANYLILPISFPEISMDAIAFVSDNQVEFIPYFANPDIYDMGNGKIYSYDVFEEFVRTNFDNLSVTNQDKFDYSGGGTGSNTNNNRLGYVWIVIGIVVVAVIGACIIHVRKKKSNIYIL